MSKTEIKPPKLVETCTLEELANWSKGRYLAGAHEAAHNIQQRYEALARAQNPNNEVKFYRDDETGGLTHEVEKSADDLELERMENEEAEEKRKAANRKQAEEEEADKAVSKKKNKTKENDDE